MSKIIVMVGPPGSGKSTYANSLINEYSKNHKDLSYVNQDTQGKKHLDIFNHYLSMGKDILVDRMGFSKIQRERYLKPAREAAYETEIIVLHEPYDVCLERCLARENHPTIKDETNARSALATFFGKYERVEDNEADIVVRIWPEGVKDPVVVCDLDGTLCNVDHRIHFVRRPKGEKKDWKSFFDGISEDEVNHWCADILGSMADRCQIIFCSGRPDNYKKETIRWLEEKPGFTKPTLYMRPRNDQRPDSIVKEIILDFEILTRFRPYFFIDDRQQVVDKWRSRGFTCLQCAKRDF